MPKPGEMWTKKNHDAEDDAMTTVIIERIEGDNVIYKDLDNTVGAYETPIVEFLSLYSKDELDLDGFQFKSTSSNDDDFPNDDDDYIRFDEVVNSDMIIDSDNNNNNIFSDSDSGDDSIIDNDDSSDKKKAKQTPKKDKRTKIKLKRPSKKSPTTSKRSSKRNKKQSKKQSKPILSRDYDTLFYPIYNEQLVPQVMTIAAVKKKPIRRTKLAKNQKQQNPIRIYIFELKPNNNINEEIERWSNWRRDTNAVKEWIQQIDRVQNNYKTNRTISNFLKALKRSFTITKMARFNITDPYILKQEMAICYVHYINDIKDRRTNDHTWEPFEKYFNTNCEDLKSVYDRIKNAKVEQNKKDPKKKDKPFQGTRKFASDAFHQFLEYVKDKTFKVLNKTEEEQAKQQLAAAYDIKIPTAGGLGKLTSLLMAKLKF